MSTISPDATSLEADAYPKEVAPYLAAVPLALSLPLRRAAKAASIGTERPDTR